VFSREQNALALVSLRHLMATCDWDQRKTAEELGVSQQHVSILLRGRTGFSRGLVAKLAALLGVVPEAIVGGFSGADDGAARTGEVARSVTSSAQAVTDDEIGAQERRVVDQLARAVDETVRLSDTTERTLATERVAHLSRALLALRQARGG
jgi:transcriptional regulator with XRE-family HTH domain